MKTILIALLALAACALSDEMITLPDGRKAFSAKAIWQGFNYDALQMEPTIGKRGQVYGTVEKTARDADGKPFILLAVTGELGAVKCTFGESAVAELRGLLGKRVVVSGVIKGMTLSIVTFTDCVITK